MSTYSFEFVTTEKCIQAFTATSPIFEGLIREVRELSRKKPDATMSVSKVKMINLVLVDLLTFLENEPTGKYLSPLDEVALPQVSDAVLTMVQFETAVDAFEKRYNKTIQHKRYWITEELLAYWNEEEQGEGEEA